jgi:uncharacterized membrane protein (UPF0127 family)
MAKLINKTKNLTVVQKVATATSLLQRLMGLMGRKQMVGEALWIPSCNSIHTCFMRFSIDLAFVDQSMSVVAIRQNVKPWRMVLPISKAYGVFELPNGSLANLSLGDVLHVDENFNRH